MACRAFSDNLRESMAKIRLLLFVVGTWSILWHGAQAQALKFGPASSPGVITHYVTKGDKVISSHTIDLNEEVRLIVEFKTPPLSTLATKRKPLVSPVQRTTLLSAVQSEHSRLRGDLATIDALGSTSPTAVRRSGTTRILMEYQTAINAAAISTRRWAISELTKLSYVKRITEDKPVKGDDVEVNHQIGADSVALNLGLTGAGVRIGLLDSGVDYNQAELGGGLGQGHTIVGGFDFVNNDDDPMDDNGHGTEVCAVMAGKTAGVAPDVSVFAYKVLDQNAQGMTSTVLAGMERALDPDNNPLTNDAVDIINLSLGGPGEPTDPLSQAVDNATQAGVLCIVAAGNNGPAFQSIGSPGCAGSALTVGACDQSDQVPSFSSRGPVSADFSLKPDIVAPGLQLKATTLGGGLAFFSGTSASAPVVSGAAALLKELHPTWSPATIKSALIGSAKNDGADVWSEGSGRIDLLSATRKKIVAIPQSVSVGLDDLSQTSWTRSDTITIYNVSDSEQELLLENTGTPATGVSVTISATNLQISPGGSTTFVVTAIVDNSQATIPSTTPPAVIGTIRISSPSDSIEIPWALGIGAYIDVRIETNLGLSQVYLVGLKGEYIELAPWDFAVNGNSYTDRVLLKPDIYEVVANLNDMWKNYFIVHDSVRVNPWATVVMQDTEAKYSVGTPARDENGNFLDAEIVLTWNAKVCSKKSGYSFGVVYDSRSLAGQTDGITMVSQLTQDYVLDYYYLSETNNPKFYSFAGSVSPVQEDHVVTLKSGDLMRHSIDFRVADSVQALKFIQFMNFSSEVNAWGSYNPNGPLLQGQAHQEWYSTFQPKSNFPYGGYLFNFQLAFTAHGTPFNPDAETQLFRLPNRFLGDDAIVRETFSYSDSAMMEIKHEDIVYGLGPRHYFGRMENAPLRLKTKTNTNVGQGSTLFLNQLLDQTSPENLLYRLRDEQGSLLGSGLASSLFMQEQYQNSIYYDKFFGVNLSASGKYSLELIDTNSMVAMRRGTARVLLTTDTRLADPNPPSMIAFSILADTVYTDTISPGKAATIEIQVTDDVALSQVSLSYQLENDTLWQSVPVQLNGNIYSGVTPSISSPVFVNMRLVATDASGNTLDYRAEPAFHVGPYSDRPPSASRTLYPAIGDTLTLYTVPQKIVFHWARSHDADSWDSLSYHVRVMGPGLGRGLNEPTKDTSMTFFIMSYLIPDTNYTWWIETSDGHVTVASDTAQFRTSSTLVSVNGESDLPKEYALYQNYPNPFNPTTTIRYDLPKESHVVLEVYNILGQEVMTLVDETKRPGRYAVMLDGARLASGMYIYRVKAGDFVVSKKLTLIR